MSELKASTMDLNDRMEDIRDLRGDGTCLHLCEGIELFGVKHHVQFLAVHVLPESPDQELSGAQVAVHPDDFEQFEAFRAAIQYDVSVLRTIQVPTYTHDYIAIIHAYGR